MNPDFETIQKYVSLIKDVITGLSAFTAAIIAVLGLQAWKKQLKGKTEYELAQRLLRATYKVREGLAWVRNPYQSAFEITQAIREANIEDNLNANSKIHARSMGAVYQKRWQQVQDAYVDLESVLLEAEAIWGQVVRENIKPLQASTATLLVNIQTRLRNLENPPSTFDADAENKIDKIIYGWPSNPDNNFFSDEITSAVNKIENFLKPHLKI